MKYAQRPKITATTMKVRDTVYEYLVREAERTKRTPPAQMELMVQMFRMIHEEFQNDDVEVVRKRIRELKQAAGRAAT